MADPARFVRQVLLPEIGEAGQARIAATVASVDGEGLAHEVATLYARGAGFREVAPGVIDRESLAPSSLVTHAAARDVLAGARATLAVMRGTRADDRAPALGETAKPPLEA
jgi:hypothetical protein